MRMQIATAFVGMILVLGLTLAVAYAITYSDPEEHEVEASPIPTATQPAQNVIYPI